MVYYSADLVRIKQLLEIAAATWDTELGADLAAAYEEINSQLKPVGIVTPLTSVPSIIQEAEAYLAASKFRGRRAGPGAQETAKAFQAEYQRLMQVFLEGEREVTSTRG